MSVGEVVVDYNDAIDRMQQSNNYPKTTKQEIRKARNDTGLAPTDNYRRMCFLTLMASGLELDPVPVMRNDPIG